MILVDTGYFLAIVQPKDALHDRANRWAAAVAEPLLVTVSFGNWSALCRRRRIGPAHLVLDLVRSGKGYELVRPPRS